MTDAKLQVLVRSCWRKKRYANEQCAREAINRVHKSRTTKLRTYYCQHCLGYHLTSKF